MKPKCALLLVIISSVVADDCPRIITRAMWGARPAKSLDYMIIPVHYVIIHHTATPSCTSLTACVERVANIQSYHMDTLHWNDLGSSFYVGGDGNVYEGRGWFQKGAHTLGYNSKSIGISLIGNFNDAPPPPAQLEATKKLLQCGVKAGGLSEDFKLLSARQVSATLSPGLALYQELTTWPDWASQP